MTYFPSVPNLLMSNVSRHAMGLSQQRLAEAQRELSTGRYHDVGLALGVRTGSSISLRLKLAEAEQTLSAVAQAKVKADVTQNTLESIAKVASNFLSSLSGARGAYYGQGLAREAAETALASLTDLLGVTFDGQYLFGGLNSDVPPLVAYSGSAAESEVDSAFLAQFGMAQDDATVSQITGSAMADFLDTAFADLFAPTAWEASWSQASSTNLLQRVGIDQIDSASNANSSFVPKLAQAFTMVASLGQGNLSQAAFEATVDKATQLLSEAQVEIGSEQSRIGIGQQRMTAAQLIYEKSRDAATSAISALESVDPYEAATRVNMLMSQLETSYSVTGRISRLSILNFI